jgi:hypothetical protein
MLRQFRVEDHPKDALRTFDRQIGATVARRGLLPTRTRSGS